MGDGNEPTGAEHGSAWQPIATAPKDGTPILVAVDSGECFPRSCWWSLAFECWVVRENIDAGEATYLKEQPTHWMPLPPPPVTP